MEKSTRHIYRPGAYVYVEGDEDSDEVFILQKGDVELTSAGEKIRRSRTRVKTGEVFGFTSSLSRRPRMESAIARRESEVLAIKRENFIEMMSGNPPIALKIINYFADELRLYNEMVGALDSIDQQDLLTDEVRLFNLGEFYQEHGMEDYAAYVYGRCLGRYPEGPTAHEARNRLDILRKKQKNPLPAPVENGIYRLYRDKQIIFAEHEEGNELYIIKEGKVKISKIYGEREILLSVLGEGEIFGELAIVSDKPRNATAICWGQAMLVPIAREALATVLRKSPGIINRIFMAISQRIWFTHIRVEARLYEHPITRIYAFLENKLLEERISLKSTKPVVLSFGIDELMRMAGVSAEQMGRAMNLLLADPNLGFNFGQTSVENPSILSTKAKFYRSRDHMAIFGEEEEAKAATARKPARAAAPEPEMVEEHRAPVEKSKPFVPEEMPIPDEMQAAEVSLKNELTDTGPPRKAKAKDAERSPGLSPNELRIPSEEIPFDFD